MFELSLALVLTHVTRGSPWNFAPFDLPISLYLWGQTIPYLFPVLYAPVTRWPVAEYTQSEAGACRVNTLHNAQIARPMDVIH